MATQLEAFDEPSRESVQPDLAHRKRNTFIIVAACGLLQLPAWGTKTFERPSLDSTNGT